MAHSRFRTNRKKSKSITGQVNTASQLLMFIMAVPAVLSLFIMLFYAAQYQASVSRMEIIASLKPLVDSEISEQLWSTISGRKTFEACGVYDTIAVINDTLDAGVEKCFLLREWEKAQRAETTHDCRKGCVGCGMKRYEGACK